MLRLSGYFASMPNSPRAKRISSAGRNCGHELCLTVLRDYPTIDCETVLGGELAVPCTRNPL